MLRTTKDTVAERSIPWDRLILVVGVLAIGFGAACMIFVEPTQGTSAALATTQG